MPKDIETRADIELLVDEFYKKATSDSIIGHFFTKVVLLDFDKHLPILYNFWESVLFGRASYRGNPVLKHIELDQKEPLTATHFQQWLQLWRATINEHFAGAKAEEAKQRAEMMEKLMLFKIDQSRNPNFIQ